MKNEEKPKRFTDEQVAQYRKDKKRAQGDALFARANVPNRALTMSLTMSLTPVLTSWLDTLRAHAGWAKTFDRLGDTFKTGNQGGLGILCGGPGVGKTTMAVELIRAKTSAGQHCYYAAAEEYLRASRGFDSEHASRQERFYDPALLVLDDVSRVGVSDWERRMLFNLVNTRFNYVNTGVKDTLLITSGKPGDLQSVFGPDILDRTKEGGVILWLSWASFRKNNTQKE